ncbi:MAG: hypothetical protein K8I29_08505 [Alphaproteobacteria bacterium]|uniref:Uncharacterized protein n=1 Tax=Candidatus Nitrobium versatile TaxID=2884831 RepID=A0A953J5V3_9BACT|nr:hypothetical protein [Candidatus Nitrobium versatile]
MVRIRLQVSPIRTLCECVACGCKFTPDGVIASLWEEDRNNRSIGYVCEWCVLRGAEDLPALLRTHAHALREKAKRLLKLSKQPFSCPPLKEYRRLEEEAGKDSTRRRRHLLRKDETGEELLRN